MGLFEARQTQGADFLAIIDGNIRREEFDLLRTEGGFSTPNNFPIESVIQPLASRQFPYEDLFEYLFAIHECDCDRLRLYSAWMKTYLAALYVYCDKIRPYIEVQSDYYYLVLEAALAQVPTEKALVAAFLSFLEWQYDWIEGDHHYYDDYYCLLTWALLRRLSGTTDHPCFRKVMEHLLAKRYSRQELSDLTVCARGIEAWFELHERIPCDPTFRTDFERIIRGEPRNP